MILEEPENIFKIIQLSRKINYLVCLIAKKWSSVVYVPLQSTQKGDKNIQK